MVKRFIYVIWKILQIILAFTFAITLIFLVYFIILNRNYFEDLERLDNYIIEKLKI